MPAPNNWNNIAAWLATAEKSAGELPECDENGKPATDDGARGAENAKDTKAVVGSNSAEGGPTNPEHGRADNAAPHTGLKQTTVGKMSDVERAVKVVEEESAKMSAADLTDDAQLEAAHAALLKAATELPTILAKAGTPHTPAATPAAAKTAADKAQAAVVDRYRCYGEDHADATIGYLRGFWDTMNFLQKSAADGSLEQLLAGGGDPAAGGMPPGGDPGAAPPGGDPAAGGMPPGGDPGAAPPGGDPAAGGDPSMDDHAAAAAELGITPQELEQLIMLLKSKAQTEAGAGALAPADKEAVDRVLTKAAYVASEIKNKMRSGKFQLKPAADGTPERARRNTAAGYFNELLRAAQ